MNKRRLIKASLWTTALSPFFFASCVDDSYDLTKDIDMTITVGGDLSIPGSGTEEFTLEEIMDLEDNSVVKADAQGNYALNKADTTETDVEIDPVHINAPASNPTTTTLYFNTPAATSEEVEAQVNDVTTDFLFSKDDVTTDIVSLTSTDVDFTAYLTLSFSQTSQNVEVITLKKGFSIEMELKGQTQPNGFVFELDNTGNYGIKEGEDQTIEFLQDQEIRKGMTLKIPVYFKRIQNFPDGQGIYEPGHFKLQTHVIANGTATTPGVPAGNIQVDLITDTEVPDITLQSVTGIVDPKIDINVDPITVEGVPDFLKDDVNLDLTNPYIKLRLENGSPADVNLKARMTWTKDGVFNEGFQIGTDLGSTPTDQTITLAGSATSEYYLSRINMENLPAGAKNIVLGDNLYELIRTIPDEIKLTDVEAKALQHDTEVELGNDGAYYEVNTIYELNAPLQFGNELNIVYKDTINDWGGDLEDITIKKAIVEMDALNGIPLNFKLNAQAIDRNGNVYPNVTVNPVKNTIAPGLKLTGENGETATESPIQLEIVCESGDMKDLDGLIVNFTADMEGVNQNATLNKGMTLKLSNIRIRIKDGVTVDLN